MKRENINTLLLAVIAGALTVQAVPPLREGLSSQWESFKRDRAEDRMKRAVKKLAQEAKKFCTQEVIDRQRAIIYSYQSKNSAYGFIYDTASREKCLRDYGTSHQYGGQSPRKYRR